MNHFIQTKAQDFTYAEVVSGIGDHKGLGDHPIVLPHFELGCIHRHKRVVFGKSPISKRFYFLVQLFAKAGYRRFRYTGIAKCLKRFAIGF